MHSVLLLICSLWLTKKNTSMRQKHQLCQMLRPHNQRRSLLITCVEGADTYLAEANMWGQALSWRCDWRQRKQLASVVICLPQRPAPPLLGPLLLTRVMRGGLALGEGCLSSLANTIADATAWRVGICVSLCVFGSRGAVCHLQAAELLRCQQGQTIPRLHWPQFSGGARWVCVCPGR